MISQWLQEKMTKLGLLAGSRGCHRYSACTGHL